MPGHFFLVCPSLFGSMAAFKRKRDDVEELGEHGSDVASARDSGSWRESSESLEVTGDDDAD